MHYYLPLGALSSHENSLLIIFGFVIVIVAIKSVVRLNRQKLWHETARAAIDKGQPLPPALVEAYCGRWGRYARNWVWARGIVWIAVGIGLYLGDDNWRKWAPLPLCVGGAFVLIGLINAMRPDKNDNPPNTSGYK